MSVEEKRKLLIEYCRRCSCDSCKLTAGGWERELLPRKCLDIGRSLDKDLDRALKLIYGEFNNESSNDPVNRPFHYTDGKIEVIDFIEDKKLGFCLGNAVKYIARAGKKDPTKEIEDLKKASWYVNRRIKELEEVAK